jgi:hypothetical protein
MVWNLMGCVFPLGPLFVLILANPGWRRGGRVAMSCPNLPKVRRAPRQAVEWLSTSRSLEWTAILPGCHMKLGCSVSLRHTHRSLHGFYVLSSSQRTDDCMQPTLSKQELGGVQAGKHRHAVGM